MIHALIQVDPPKAKKQILAALRASGMHRGDAAKALECTQGTLARWIETLGLGAEIETMAAQAKAKGWHHKKNAMGGRPEGAKDKVPRGPRNRAA